MAAQQTRRATKGAGSQRRRSRAELAELVLSAGRDLLVREGLTLGVEEVTFKRVFDHLEETRGVRVTYASVMGRIWENQADFQLALIRSVLDQEPIDAPELVRLIGRIEQAISDADLSTEETRWEAMVEVCRVGAQDNLELLRADVWWPLWISIWSWIATHRGEIHDDLLDGLLGNYHGGDEAFALLYAMVNERLGFQLKPGLSLNELVVMLSSAAEGSAIRERIEPAAMHLERNDAKQWTSLGLMFEGIIRMAIEPIPGWQPPS